MKKALLFLALPTLFMVGCDTTSVDESTEPIDDGGATIAFTRIPDSAFEQALIDLGFDNALDGEIRTETVETISTLLINDKGISNLTGLEDFVNLTNLQVNDNNLSQLNVNANTRLKFLYATGNNLSQLNVSALPELEKLGMEGNGISSLDVTNNPNLQILTVFNNELDAINVASNPDLNVFSVVGNPLSCVQVSAEQLDEIPMMWEIDAEDSYSLKCE